MTMWTEYQPKLEQDIWRKTSDSELTEDLAAQVFVKAIEAIAQGKGPHSNESGWIYRIAHNQVVDHYRKCSRQRITALEDYVPCQSVTPLESAELAFDIKLYALPCAG
jgi:RNA polymerase sigma-70 factor, ECF subfamily